MMSIYLCPRFDVTGNWSIRSVVNRFLNSSLLRQNTPTWRLRSNGCRDGGGGDGGGGSLSVVVGFGLCFVVVDWIYHCESYGGVP